MPATAIARTAGPAAARPRTDPTIDHPTTPLPGDVSHPTPERFARLLRGLAEDAFAAFVADLWAARGFSTEIDGDAVVATRAEPARERRVLLVRHTAPRLARAPTRADRPEVTDVVASGPASPRLRALAADLDADLHDADDLHDAVRYALDAEARDGLFRRHFDRPAASFERSPDRSASPVVGALSGLGATRVLATVGVVLFLVAAALAISPGSPGSVTVDDAGAPSAIGSPPDGTSGAGLLTAAAAAGTTPAAADESRLGPAGWDPALDERAWPMFRGGPAHGGARPAPTLPRDPPALVTRIDLGGPVISSAAIANGSIYVGSGAGVHAISGGTAARRWFYDTDRPVGSSPAVVDGTVYVGVPASSTPDAPAGLAALRTGNGTVRWIAPIGSVGLSSPAVANGTVYVGGVKGVFALSADTGDVRWGFDTESGVRSSPAVSNGTVYVGGDDSLYALSAATGEVRWRFETGGEVDSSPAVSNGTVYVGSADGYVYAVGAPSGEERWRYGTGGAVFSSPAVSNGTVYVGGSDGAVYALAAADGTPRWRHETGAPVVSSPAVEGDAVLVGSADGHVYALSATSGERAWRFETGGRVTASPAVANGLLLVGSRDGHLYVVRTRVSLGFEGVPIGGG